MRQALSVGLLDQHCPALEFAKFTSSESEFLLQTPERRKVLIMLMIAGSIGIASVTATLTVGAPHVSDTAQGLSVQGPAIVLAFVFTRLASQAGFSQQTTWGFRWQSFVRIARRTPLEFRGDTVAENLNMRCHV